MEMQNLQTLTAGSRREVQRESGAGGRAPGFPGVATSWLGLSEGAWQARGQFCQREVQLWFAQQND